jgi:hypothetical protein
MKVLTTLTALIALSSVVLAQDTMKDSTMKDGMKDSMMKDISASFTTVHAPTTGVATIKVGKEGSTLELSNFKTEPAPDLHVWLYNGLPSEIKDGSPLKVAGKYIDLGGLKTNLSSASIKIPAGTDLNKYNSVVLWCDQFSVTFGVARFAKGDAAMMGKEDAMMAGKMMADASLATGSFKSVAAPTKGDISISQGKNNLVLNIQNFKTEPAPDLEVLLYKKLPASSVKDIKKGYAGQFIRVGVLKNFSGEVTLNLPKGIKLENYRTLVLWCNQVKALFATANLEQAGMMKK